MARFWRYIRPWNLYKSDRAVFNDAAKGTLTTRRLLEIEYGAYPLEGAQISADNDHTVQLKAYWQDEERSVIKRIMKTASSTGYFSIKKNSNNGNDRTIFLNSFVHSPLGQGRITALYHIPVLKKVAQFGLAMLAGTLSVGKAVMVAAQHAYGAALVAVGASSARFAIAAQILTLPYRAAMDPLGREHIHILQTTEAEKTKFNPYESTLYKDLKKSFNGKQKALAITNTICSFGMLPYISRDAEIQANMHTALARGYRKKWQRLPRTRHELWAALAELGIKPPAAIREELKNTTEDKAKTFLKPGLRATFNRYSQKLIRTDVADLDAINEGLLRDDLKEKFWRDTLPYLYGHLLELYGDPAGRQRLTSAPASKQPTTDIAA